MQAKLLTPYIYLPKLQYLIKLKCYLSGIIVQLLTPLGLSFPTIGAVTKSFRLKTCSNLYLDIMCASGPKICRYIHLKVRCQKLCTADLTWGPVLQHRSLPRLYIEVRGRQMPKNPNKQKKKNVEIKQRNSSICSVYLIERLALGLPIQQSLESLGAKMLLLWY